MNSSVNYENKISYNDMPHHMNMNIPGVSVNSIQMGQNPHYFNRKNKIIPMPTSHNSNEFEMDPKEYKEYPYPSNMNVSRINPNLHPHLKLYDEENTHNYNQNYYQEKEDSRNTFANQTSYSVNESPLESIFENEKLIRTLEMELEIIKMRKALLQTHLEQSKNILLNFI